MQGGVGVTARIGPEHFLSFSQENGSRMVSESPPRQSPDSHRAAPISERCAAPVAPIAALQGYLVHKKQRPPKTLK